MLEGTEFFYVTGVLANGMPSGETFIVTTQEVANLAGGGSALTESEWHMTTTLIILALCIVAGIVLSLLGES